MTDLRKYVAQTGVKTIKTLAYLTGISENILNGVADGKYKLGSIHKNSIRSVLPNVDDSLLSPKHKEFPSDIVTDKGKIPEGTVLMNIQASEVLIGDYLLAAHQTTVAGSHWAAVVSLKEQGRNLILHVGNDIEIGVSKTNLVKVARRSNG